MKTDDITKQLCPIFTVSFILRLKFWFQVDQLIQHLLSTYLLPNIMLGEIETKANKKELTKVL